MAKAVGKKKMETIDRIEYDRGDILGRGTFGVVYSGTFCGENGERIKVAVKRLLHLDINTNEQEVVALEKLKNHPNIVFLFGAEKDDDFHYFAFELCAASMEDVFNPADNPKYGGPLPSELDVLLQLSKGLRHIHAHDIDGKGFVHRDVKPGNVLISFPNKDDGTVVMKWADFGLSKPVSPRGTFIHSDKRGTVNWIAPEILAMFDDEETTVETKKGTVESDTWSFGCVIFAYLTKGKHPFAGDKGFHSNIRNGTPINLSALKNDHFAFNVIKEMIQKEPKDRMKLYDVVEIFKKVKATQPHQKDDNNGAAHQELVAGQLYSWEQWNLALKNGQLFVWNENVTIEGFIPKDYDSLIIKLNESEKIKTASVKHGRFLIDDGAAAAEAGRKENLSREMLYKVGIPPGTPSKSPLNVHFMSHDGGKWTVSPSMMGEKLNIKREGKRNLGHFDEMVLFQTLPFHSAFHLDKDRGKRVVCMTKTAKDLMKKELLTLISEPCSEPKNFDRIAALLQVGVNPNCTNTNGETPLILCLTNQKGESRLKCLKILLEGNQSRDERIPPRKVDVNVKNRETTNAFQLLVNNATARDSSFVHESLDLLVQAGMDVNLKDKYGRTALHWLCENCKSETIVDSVKLLVEKGVDVNWKDGDGSTALHLLCQNYKNKNIVDVLKLLIDSGVDFNFEDKDESNALHLLCGSFNNENIVDAMKILVEKVVDVNLKNGDGGNALHCLCQNYKNENIVDAIKFLIEKGVDLKLTDKNGRNAFHFLCQNYKNDNILDSIQILVQNGVDVTLKDRWGRTALHLLCGNYKNENIIDAIKFLIEKGVDVDLKDNDGQTALHYLCEKYENENIVDAVKLLIQKSDDVNLKDKYGRTTLHILSNIYNNQNIVDALKILIIEKNVDVNLQDNDGRTALHWLCEYYKNENIIDVMTFLIEKSDGINLKDKYGRTALHLLCQNYPNENIVDAMKLLIEKGVEVNSQDDFGHTALHSLCRNDEKENMIMSVNNVIKRKRQRQHPNKVRKILIDVMKVLIVKGVDVNLKDINGHTALHILSIFYDNENIADVMKILVQNGADVNLQDENGRAALHWFFLKYKKENIVDATKLLIEDGSANVNLKDKEGRPALHLLCENYKNENIGDVMNILVQNGSDVNLQDGIERTALHYLCKNYKNENMADVMKILVENGADVNLKEKDGQTALHWLCLYYKNENIVDAMELLMEKGVDVNWRDSFKQRAIDYLGRDQQMVGYKETFLQLKRKHKKQKPRDS